MSSVSTFKRTVKNTCKKYRILPLKRLGQNFLIDKLALKRIISAANPEKDDIILEIGPGTGILTRELAKRAGEVIAVEKDPRMVEVLKEALNGFQNTEIVSGDVLKLEIEKLFKPRPFAKGRRKIKNFKVVANLPFYLTAPLIRKFLENIRVKPRQMVLVVQKEVAQRIVARPPRMNLLAVSVQFYGKPEIVSYISKSSFWPRPKVDGAILKIIPQNLWRSDLHKDNLSRSDLHRLFFKVVKAGFSQPRKTLLNNLSKKLNSGKEKTKEWLLKNNINPNRRAEALEMKEWFSLVKNFSF